MPKVISLADYKQKRETQITENNELKLESSLNRLLESLIGLAKVEEYSKVLSNFELVTEKVMSEGSIQSLKEVILESNDYLSDRVIISLYYYLFNKEEGWKDSSIILTFLSSYLENKESPLDVDCLLEFVDNDLEFKSLNEDEQRALIGNKKRDKVLKHKER